MNEASPPVLSIILPTYNRIELLKETLASFVGKLNCSYEVIVVDDGSTDGTRAYLEGLDDPIVVFFQTHLGPQVARNVGMAHAQGQYLKFHDDDDLLEPAAIDAQVVYMKAHSEIDVCYSDWGYATYQKKQLTGRWLYIMNQIPDPVEYFIRDWWCASFVYLFRRGIMDGLTWAETPVLTDFVITSDVALRGAQFGYVSTFPTPLGWYRAIVDKDKRLSTSASNVVRAQCEIRILDKMQRYLEQTATLTPSRRQALVTRYYAIARRVFPDDRQFFRQLVARVIELDPRFEPDGPRYRLAVRWLGFENGEWLRRLNLALRARLRAVRPKQIVPATTSITCIHVDRQTVLPKL